MPQFRPYYWLTLIKISIVVLILTIFIVHKIFLPKILEIKIIRKYLM